MCKKNIKKEITDKAKCIIDRNYFHFKTKSDWLEKKISLKKKEIII